MRRVVLTLVGLFILATTIQAQDKVQALIDKAIQARGGAEKLNKLKAWETKTKGSLNIPQLGGSTEFTGEEYGQLPDKNRINLNLQVMGQDFPVSVGFNGKEAWRNLMGMTQDITGPELKSRAQALYADRLTLLTPLKDKGYVLTALDEIKVDGKAAVGIKVAMKDQTDVKLFFDKDSSLLVQVQSTAMDPMSGGEVPTETTLSKHKAFDGIQFPTKMVIKREGNVVQEVEIVELKIVDKIDDSKFQKP